MTKKSVSVRTFSGEESAGELTIVSFSPAQRTKRTLVRTGSILLVTVIGALIPVAHFIIVPVGLIAAVITFSRSRSTKEQVTGGDITCPACKEKITLCVRPLKIPLKESCDHCHRQVMIS